MGESADIAARDARTAAEMSADVGVEHIANVYAKALVAATENAGQTAAVLEEFEGLIGDVFAKFPKLETILASALVSHEDKEGILDRLFQGRLTPLFLDFLKVVSRHGRLDCLRAIYHQSHARYDQLRGRVRVRFTTATPMPTGLGTQLVARLRDLLGGEPVLEQVVDSSLIGGAVIRVGDTVYDGSVATQLQTVRQQMIDRSVHEIQSRRNRFRNSAGN